MPKKEQEEIGWAAGQVKCDVCGYEWTAVRPEELDKLQCPNCGNMVNFENI